MSRGAGVVEPRHGSSNLIDILEETMPYSEILVRPMRQELTRLGVEELKTAEDVERTFAEAGTTLVVVNSVCGCAARNARPAVAMALEHELRPDRSTTVF